MTVLNRTDPLADDLAKALASDLAAGISSSPAGYAGVEGDERWAAEVRRLAELRNATILAHNYQLPAIQDVADHVGDSLALSRIAAEAPEETIVFCGVHFMAETAKILSPEKTVLIPDQRAGCSLADSITAEDLQENLHVWDGECHVHAGINGDELTAQARMHPDAELFVHPECGCATSALYLAGEGAFPQDRVKILSTGGMLDAARATHARQVLVATEVGMLYQLRNAAPDVDFRAVNDRASCKYMKMITPAALLRCLIEGADEVDVDAQIARLARQSVQRMIAIGQPGGGE